MASLSWFSLQIKQERDYHVRLDTGTGDARKPYAGGTEGKEEEEELKEVALKSQKERL